MRRKNILFLQIYGGGIMPGGTEVYLRNLLKALNKTNRRSQFYLALLNKKKHTYSNYVALVEDSIFTRFLENYNVLKIQVAIPIIGLITFLWGIYWLKKIASKIIKNNHIDIIYANGGQLSAIVAYLLNKQFNIKYILHFHGLFNFSHFLNDRGFSLRKLLLKRITQNYLFHATQIITNSQDIAQDIEKIKSFPKKCVVVQCFVDQKVFYPRNKLICRKKINLKPEDFIILSTNRLEEDKRIHFILDCITTFNNNKIKIVFIGDGPLKAKIKKLSAVDTRIIYHAPMGNEMLPVYINAADVVWGACSMSYISLTLIEALACGVPIMASDIPVSHDITYGKRVTPNTIPRSIGFLVKEDSHLFKNRVNELIDNRQILERKKNACLRFYEDNYSQKSIKKIAKIIYDL